MSNDMGADATGCPLCAGERLATEYWLGNGFRTARCRACNFVFLHPYPSEAFLEEHYRSRELYGHYSPRREDYDRAVTDRAALIRRALSHFAGAPRSGRAMAYKAETQSIP